MSSTLAQLADFGFTYTGSDSPALQEINLGISKGELVGVIGPSGAGKSSLGYALSGFIPHFFTGDPTGAQRLFGEDMTGLALSDIAGRVGMVVQNPFNQISGARYSVREEVAFGLENMGIAKEVMEARVEEVMDRFKLDDLQDRSPYELSGGQQQRLALASILAMEPDLLILDEPTSQLDPAGAEEVFDSVHTLTEESSTAVILITHKLEWLAEVADRIIVVVNGTIQTEGPPREILAKPDLDSWGIGTTAYTRAARLAIPEGKTQNLLPPVTLDQAVEYFEEWISE
jgi:energy-coupling factor transporter ATP-binding protein EcfA2